MRHAAVGSVDKTVMGAWCAGSYEVTPPGRSRAECSPLGRRIGRRTATIASVVRWVRPSGQHQNHAHCCAGRRQRRPSCGTHAVANVVRDAGWGRPPCGTHAGADPSRKPSDSIRCLTVRRSSSDTSLAWGVLQSWIRSGRWQATSRGVVYYGIGNGSWRIAPRPGSCRRTCGRTGGRDVLLLSPRPARLGSTAS